MLKIHLLLAIRHFWKNKLAAGINLLGLSIGLGAFLLIFQYIAFEWSFYTDHPNSDQVFRVLTEEDQQIGITLPPGYGPLLAQQFPQVQKYTRIYPDQAKGVYRVLGTEQPAVFRETEAAFVDHDFSSLFNLQFTQQQGDLSEPFSLVMSESTAERYFGDSPALGKQIRVDNQFDNTVYQVTGIFEDMPENADIRYDILLSLETLENEANRDGNTWADPNGVYSSFVYLFVELGSPEEGPLLAQEATQWVKTLLPDEEIQVLFQPLSAMHLGERVSDPLPTYGSQVLVWFLFIVALLIVGIAWVNYINLSTAQGLERAKEVGVRKVAGARRLQLIQQYLLETFLLTLLASYIAFSLIPMVQPYFNDLVGLPLGFHVFEGSVYAWIGGAVILLGTLISGSYVALGLTGFSPAQILRGRFTASPKGVGLRKGLVVFQFTISIAFIACTFILMKQLNFIRDRDKGIAVEQRVAIKGPNVREEGFDTQKQVFRNSLAQLPYVQNFCSSGNLPGRGYNFSASGITRQTPSEGEEDKSYRMLFIDEHFPQTFGMKVRAGRPFTSLEAQKSWGAEKVLVNALAAEELGFPNPEAALGKFLSWNDQQWEIVGVLNDYNHRSVHVPVEPMVFLPGQQGGYYTLVMDLENFSDNIAYLESLYREAFPGNPFSYEFLDETFAQLYLAEERLSRLFTLGSFIALFISAMGLLGLATFMAQRKTKEIGIRKILGASVFQIVQLISRDFFRLVGIALVIATPIAWWTMHQWLQNFAYQVSIQLWVFVGAGLLALLIAFLTIGVQSLRVASDSPVKALRSE